MKSKLRVVLVLSSILVSASAWAGDVTDSSCSSENNAGIAEIKPVPTKEAAPVQKPSDAKAGSAQDKK